MQTITVKAGESYSQGGTVTTDGTTPIDLTGYTATSQVRDTAGAEIGELTIAIDAGSAGTFEISATAAETLTWTVGDHRCDMRFESSTGEVTVSPTFAIRVVTTITEGA